MKSLAWVFAGLLLAAAVHVAMMSPAERAAILRISSSPEAGEVAARPAGSPEGREAAATPQRAPGTAASRPRPPASIATSSATSTSSSTSSGSAGAGAGADLDPDPHAYPTADVASVPAPPPSGLVVPVRGVAPSQLAPTFSDARGGGRVHEALDIMAPAGTPVLAVADGHVEKLFDSERGGLTIYQFDPDGRHAYYYAHLERYAAGLAEGQRVRQGQVIGYVGSTGNAEPSAPHLHFAIFELGPERQWWTGTPIDPYPLLAAPR